MFFGVAYKIFDSLPANISMAKPLCLLGALEMISGAFERHGKDFSLAIPIRVPLG
jgi:hypothetical protein